MCRLVRLPGSEDSGAGRCHGSCPSRNEGRRLARFCALVPMGSVSLVTESHGVGPRSGPFRFQATAVPFGEAYKRAPPCRQRTRRRRPGRGVRPVSRRSESLIHSEGGWHLEVSKMLPPAIGFLLTSVQFDAREGSYPRPPAVGRVESENGLHAFAPAMLLRSRCLADRRAARLAPTS